MKDATPALEAFGYSLDRFEEVTSGAEITEIEKDLFEWACDVGMSVFMGFETKNVKDRKRHLTDAVTACMDKLDREIINEIIVTIYTNISKTFEEDEPFRTKPDKKKKK